MRTLHGTADPTWKLRGGGGLRIFQDSCTCYFRVLAWALGGFRVCEVWGLGLSGSLNMVPYLL